MIDLMSFAEGSASDEASEGAGEAKRRLVPTIKNGGSVMIDLMSFAEGSASDEASEGAGEAKRRLVPTIRKVAV
jgi:hypothetical protein